MFTTASWRRLARQVYRIGWSRVALVVIGGLVHLPAAQAEPPRVEEFFRNPAFSEPALSPDGKLIAALVATKAGRVQLAILDPSDFAKSRNVAGFSDADIRSLKWINDRRIVFNVYDATAGGGDQYAPGLFAVDADGGDFRRLVDRNWRGFVSERRIVADKVLPWWTFFLAPTRERKSDDVFVVQFPRDPRSARPNDERPDGDTSTQHTHSADNGAVTRSSGGRFAVAARRQRRAKNGSDGA